MLDPPSQRPIGYYVHHHGMGHVARFRAVRDASRHWIVPISERALTDSCRRPGVRLPSDCSSPAPSGDVTAGGALHWAPLVADISSPRLGAFVRWLDAARPIGVVVDVSVESLLTCRLAGVPTIALRQHGDRSDDAHILGYRVANRLLAPWPIELEDPSTPQWIIDKTDHIGFVWTEFSYSETESTPTAVAEVGPCDVVVLWGSGGGTLSDVAVSALADAGDARVHLVGSPFDAGVAARWTRDRRVNVVGWVDEVAPLLVNRPVVVTSAGNNTVALAARHRCPLVVVPQERPFNEQHRHAERLDAIGAAVAVTSPATAPWRNVLELARSRAEVLAELAEPDGARRAADVIASCFTGVCA